MWTKRILHSVLHSIAAFVVLSVVDVTPLMAQGINLGEQGVSRPLVLILVLMAMGLAPFVIMMTTSFVKISVVLALLRNALGTQQIPPNPIITGLAMILTIYIMIPVGMDIYKATGDTVNKGSKQPLLSEASVSLLIQATKEAREPMRDFLMKHAHTKDRHLFYAMAKKMMNEEDRDLITDRDFHVLIPAFVISELVEAFQIGFLIYLPFLVIDIVTVNVLLSLGMFQVSPITIALPFKLLLFVLVEGWHLIAKGLVLGYI
jgi:type III secretion protein R